ncbi:hypothetical protein D3C81_2309720 [compost metagenome]
MEAFEGIELQIGYVGRRHLFLNAVEPLVLLLEEEFPLAEAQAMQGGFGEVVELLAL